MAESNADNPSMDDILNTIRGVIAGDDDKDPSKPMNSESEQKEAAPQVPADAPEENTVQEDSSPDASTEGEEDDVLELTDIIEDGEAMSEASVNTPEESNSEGLLSDIDNMLGADDDVAEDAATVAEAQAEPQPEAAEEVSAEPESLDEPSLDVPETSAEEDEMIASAQPQAEPEIEAEPQPQPEEAKAEQVESHPSDRLLSETAAATSQAVLKEMMSALPRQKVNSPATRGGTTLEDLVIEAIRPYLSEWMDKNLATIVKQLVEKEIKHLIPRDVE